MNISTSILDRLSLSMKTIGGWSGATTSYYLSAAADIVKSFTLWTPAVGKVWYVQALGHYPSATPVSGVIGSYAIKDKVSTHRVPIGPAFPVPVSFNVYSGLERPFILPYNCELNWIKNINSGSQGFTHIIQYIPLSSSEAPLIL